MEDVCSLAQANLLFCSVVHARSPGVAAADYVSTSSFLPVEHPFSKTPHLTPGNEIAHEECGRLPVT